MADKIDTGEKQRHDAAYKRALYKTAISTIILLLIIYLTFTYSTIQLFITLFAVLVLANTFYGTSISKETVYKLLYMCALTIIILNYLGYGNVPLSSSTIFTNAVITFMIATGVVLFLILWFFEQLR